MVKNTSGEAVENIGDSTNQIDDRSNVEKIVNFYSKHSSIKSIRENTLSIEKLDFPLASVEEVNSIIKSLNPNKTTGPNGIPIKIIKSAATVIDSHITNIINIGIKTQTVLKIRKLIL